MLLISYAIWLASLPHLESWLLQDSAFLASVDVPDQFSIREEIHDHPASLGVYKFLHQFWF